MDSNFVCRHNFLNIDLMVQKFHQNSKLLLYFRIKFESHHWKITETKFKYRIITENHFQKQNPGKNPEYLVTAWSQYLVTASLTAQNLWSIGYGGYLVGILKNLNGNLFWLKSIYRMFSVWQILWMTLGVTKFVIVPKCLQQGLNIKITTYGISFSNREQCRCSSLSQ